jgi:DNA-binding protein HU-beta
MVAEVKQGLDKAYIKAIERLYNREDNDIELMIASSKRVAAAKQQRGMAASKEGKHLTQAQIIDQLADKVGLKRVQAKELFRAMASLAATEVRKHGEFIIPGFGKLLLSTRKTREGRNPATGEPIKIAAKNTIKFRIGKSMKDAAGTK